MRLRFTQASRKHRIGKAHAVHVLTTVVPTPTTTRQGNPAWLYVGPDDRGVELEIIAVEIGDDTLLVTHVMPMEYRRK